MAVHHTIVRGDSRRLRRVDDESVHLVVTSPPYWQLKDYGSASQIGFHDTYEEYVNNLNLVWQECARVLAPGGRLCINVGDQFARAAFYGRYKVIPIRTEVVRFAEAIGLDHMGSIIWQKVTTCNTSGGATVMGSFPFPPNGVVKVDYEYILLFKKPGRRRDTVDRERKDASRMTTEQWNEYFYGHWYFSGVRQERHLAAFPEELPRRLIRMFTFVGDTVLDPFLGSGTTALVSHQEARSSIGYEVSEEFVEVALRRLREAEPLFGAPEVEVKSEDVPADVDPGRLPYVFRDPVRIDRPRKGKVRTYGSRINGSEPARHPTYRVDAVLGHDRIRLEDGNEVVLLGVGRPRESARAAEDGLRKLCVGKRVTLAEDPTARGQEVLRYVHLRNRKFVNAHMIKGGFAEPDRERAYRHRKRFEGYAARASGETGQV